MFLQNPFFILIEQKSLNLAMIHLLCIFCKLSRHYGSCSLLSNCMVLTLHYLAIKQSVYLHTLVISMWTAHLTKKLTGLNSASNFFDVFLCGWTRHVYPHNDLLEILLLICLLVIFLSHPITRISKFSECDVSPTMSCPFMAPLYNHLCYNPCF